MLPVQFSSKVCMLRSWYFKYWMFPKEDEVQRLLWFKSKKLYENFFRLLIAWKFISESQQGRTPTDKMTWIPMISDQTVPAWFPTPWRDDDQYISFDLNKELIPDINATTLITVSWESMIEAGILPWDQIVVHQTWATKDWSLVIAIIDNGYTLKYLHYDHDGTPYLRAANKMLFPEPLYPSESLEVFGVVTAIIRKII